MKVMANRRTDGGVNVVLALDDGHHVFQLAVDTDEQLIALLTVLHKVAGGEPKATEETRER